jgi:hypothetical protein
MNSHREVIGTVDDNGDTRLDQVLLMIETELITLIVAIMFNL